MTETKTTARGKELRLRLIPNTTLYEIYFYPGGEVPKELQGGFTSVDRANKEIEIYLAKKNK